ncbi:iron-containing redox enzyme family protein [Actinomadura sp. KC06]|uniref:iron-containing redox enzyme family protein n=1 Tax=Actinomadura sp. KC06 TaxID=2530369 RepID=UPI001AA00667|nr:iron-containing redox enzyme family protein [Actinomadura sp. KC06]
MRGAIESLFLDALRRDTAADADVDGVLEGLLIEPVDGRGISPHLCGEGEWWQLLEHAALRSVYHLKEADPHAWVIPRLRAAPRRRRWRWRKTSSAAATPKKIHQGMYAAAEITTAPSAWRMVAAALERSDGGPRARLFYTKHIEADAVHEQMLRHDVIGGLLADEPELAPGVAPHVRATTLLENRFAGHLLGCRRSGRSLLRRPLAATSAGTVGR